MNRENKPNSNEETSIEQRAEQRVPAQIAVTAKGHAVFGHDKLEAVIVDISQSGAAIRASHPFEVNSAIDIYIDGQLAAKGEIVSVLRDETAGDEKLKVRMGIEIIEKNEHWQY